MCMPNYWIAILYVLIIVSSKHLPKEKIIICLIAYGLLDLFSVFSFHQQVVFDEGLMRVQTFIYQCSYILIHHFIKIIRMQPIVLLLRYRTVRFFVWENSDTLGYSPLDRWCK